MVYYIVEIAKYKGYPVFLYTVNDDDEETGLVLSSHVGKPAVAFDENGNQKYKYGTWVMNSEPSSLIKNAFDDEKMQVTSVLFSAGSMVFNEASDDMPNSNIKKGEKFYGIATPESIEGIVKKFKRTQTTNFIVDQEHSMNPTQDAYLLEDWIVKNPNNDKANELGLFVKKGDYVQTHQITNKAYWDRLKSGEFTGFSNTSFLALKPVTDIKLIKNQNINTMTDQEIKALQDKVTALEAENAKAKTDLAESAKQIENFKAEIEAKKTEAQTSANEKETATKESETLKKEVETLKVENKKLEESYSKTKGGDDKPEPSTYELSKTIKI